MTNYCHVSGKHSYATRGDAEKVLKIVQRRPGHKRKGAGVYRCELPGCDAFHTTQCQGLLQHLRKAEQRRKA